MKTLNNPSEAAPSPVGWAGQWTPGPRNSPGTHRRRRPSVTMEPNFHEINDGSPAGTLAKAQPIEAELDRQIVALTPPVSEIAERAARNQPPAEWFDDADSPF